MTTTPLTTGPSFVQAAIMLAAHLAEHALPEPAFLTVTTGWKHSVVTAQLHSTTVPGVAAELLAWVDTLSTVTVTAWRVPERERVHLSITSTLTSPTGTVELKVFGGAQHDPAWFADLTPGQERTASLAELHAWAANEPSTTNSPILPTAPGARG
jgi:hypothetical protein